MTFQIAIIGYHRLMKFYMYSTHFVYVEELNFS